MLCLFSFVCVAAIWQQGIVGGWLLCHGLSRFLPLDLDDGLSITRISIEDCALVPDRGLLVSVSPRTFKRLLRQVSPLFVLLPPGVVDGVVLHGQWLPEKAAPEFVFPIALSCNQVSGISPRVVFRCPVDDLNRILDAELSDDLHDKESYIFGTYDVNQRIRFRTLSIQSEERPPGIMDAPFRFRVHATGSLRYRVKDGFIGVRVTAKVKALSGTMEFGPVIHENGVGLEYACVVDTLDIAVDNMAPWLERKVAENLRQSIERSQNKRRRREKYARLRLPLWVPLDSVVDIQVFEPAGNAEDEM